MRDYKGDEARKSKLSLIIIYKIISSVFFQVRICQNCIPYPSSSHRKCCRRCTLGHSDSSVSRPSTRFPEKHKPTFMPCCFITITLCIFLRLQWPWAITLQTLILNTHYHFLPSESPWQRTCATGQQPYVFDTFRQEKSAGQNELSGQMVSYILLASEELIILNDWKSDKTHLWHVLLWIYTSNI